jgi:hypothetical protein
VVDGRSAETYGWGARTCSAARLTPTSPPTRLPRLELSGRVIPVLWRVFMTRSLECWSKLARGATHEHDLVGRTSYRTIGQTMPEGANGRWCRRYFGVPDTFAQVRFRDPLDIVRLNSV